MEFLPFSKAMEFVQTINLKSHKEWVEYCKSVKKPPAVPYNPDREYKDKGWISWGDWLGTTNVAPKNRKYLPFKRAREIVRSLSIKNQGEFRAYSKSITRRLDIPSAPQRVYKKEWKGINDWLGTDRLANQNKEFWAFEQAREFVRSLRLKSVGEWEKYCKSDEKPVHIPYSPAREYKDKGWISWGDWLGTYTIAPQNKIHRSFG